MNTAHEGMDEMIDHLDANPHLMRRSSAHRALPLASYWPTRHERETYGECNDWPARRVALKAADPFPVVVDRVREDFDADDQSESADSEVMAWLLKGLAVVLLACFCAWCIASYLVLAHA